MQRKDCEQLNPVNERAQYEENKENVEWSEEDKSSETQCFVNESVNDPSEGHDVQDVAEDSDVQQNSLAVQVSRRFNKI